MRVGAQPVISERGGLKPRVRQRKAPLAKTGGALPFCFILFYAVRAAIAAFGSFSMTFK